MNKKRYGYIYITKNNETGHRYVGKHARSEYDPDYYTRREDVISEYYTPFTALDIEQTD